MVENLLCWETSHDNRLAWEHPIEEASFDRRPTVADGQVLEEHRVIADFIIGKRSIQINAVASIVLELKRTAHTLSTA